MKKRPIYTLSAIVAHTGEVVESFDGLLTSIYYSEYKAVKAAKKYERQNSKTICYLHIGEYETESGIFGNDDIIIPACQHPAY
jgi:hypothetical protein